MDVVFLTEGIAHLVSQFRDYKTFWMCLCLKWITRVLIISGRLYVDCIIISLMLLHASLEPDISPGSRMPLKGESRNHPQ